MAMSWTLRCLGSHNALCLQFDEARIAQLAEQLICNQQVGGSNPPAGSKLPENPVFRARSDS